MMDASFVQAIAENNRTPRVIATDRVFIPTGWIEAPPKIHAVSPLVVHTLTGFVDYCRENRDALTLASLMVHVKEPGRVELRGPLEGVDVDYRRQTYLAATTELTGRCGLPFGQYVDAETFYVQLQTGFVASDARDELLKLVASIRENSVRETVDSGVAQQVTTGRGVALVGNAPVPNPVTLAPYRTFREITQPASLFVLRLRESKDGDKPQVALFEADGGQWKLEAVQDIALHLRARLPDGLAVVA